MGGLLAIAAEKLEDSDTPLDFIQKWGDASISGDSAATRKDTFLAVQKHSGKALENNWKALLALRGKLPDPSNPIRNSDAPDTSRATGSDDNARGDVILLRVGTVANLSPSIKIYLNGASRFTTFLSNLLPKMSIPSARQRVSRIFYLSLTSVHNLTSNSMTTNQLGALIKCRSWHCRGC